MNNNWIIVGNTYINIEHISAIETNKMKIWLDSGQSYSLNSEQITALLKLLFGDENQ